MMENTHALDCIWAIFLDNFTHFREEVALYIDCNDHKWRYKASCLPERLGWLSVLHVAT